MVSDLVLSTTALAAATLAVAGWLRVSRRERRTQAALEGLSTTLRELTARLEATEGDVANALTAAEISESLLVEKGIADEEDLEEARRRFSRGDAPPTRYQPERDGELN